MHKSEQIYYKATITALAVLLFLLLVSALPGCKEKDNDYAPKDHTHDNVSVHDYTIQPAQWSNISGTVYTYAITPIDLKPSDMVQVYLAGGSGYIALPLTDSDGNLFGYAVNNQAVYIELDIGGAPVNPVTIRIIKTDNPDNKRNSQ